LILKSINTNERDFFVRMLCIYVLTNTHTYNSTEMEISLKFMLFKLTNNI